MEAATPRTSRTLQRRARWLLLVGVLLIAAYCGKLYHMWARQESYWFLFTPASVGDWSPRGLSHEDVSFPSADGTQLFGWYAPVPQPRGVLLFLHGSGGNIALPYQRTAIERLQQLGMSVFVFDYRGFGRSQGTLTDESQVHADAEAALAWLCHRENVEPSDVVLLGRSMGSAVAMRLAGRRGARCVIMENGIPSLTEVAARNYRWAPMRWIQRYRFEVLPDFARYTGPFFQSHAERDELVPMDLAREVFEAARGRKEFFVAPGLDHAAEQPEAYYAALNAFLDEVLASTGVRGSGDSAQPAPAAPPQSTNSARDEHNAGH